MERRPKEEHREEHWNPMAESVAAEEVVVARETAVVDGAVEEKTIVAVEVVALPNGVGATRSFALSAYQSLPN